MAHADLEAEIAAHPFLIGMSAHHLKLLADCAMRSHFAQDEIIFREGETANRFYLLQQGEVILESTDAQGAKVVIDTVGDEELLGWSWLFPPYVWHFTARASKPTSAIFFYGTVLREYCEKDQALGFELFKRMSAIMTRRLQLARARLLKAYSKMEASGLKREE